MMQWVFMFCFMLSWVYLPLIDISRRFLWHIICLREKWYANIACYKITISTAYCMGTEKVLVLHRWMGRARRTVCFYGVNVVFIFFFFFSFQIAIYLVRCWIFAIFFSNWRLILINMSVEFLFYFRNYISFETESTISIIKMTINNLLLICFSIIKCHCK